MPIDILLNEELKVTSVPRTIDIRMKMINTAIRFHIIYLNCSV
jgi:hypothetical protein